LVLTIIIIRRNFVPVINKRFVLPALAAVAAVRTAPGLIAGAAKTYGAFAAGSALDGDLRLIGEGFQARG